MKVCPHATGHQLRLLCIAALTLLVVAAGACLTGEPSVGSALEIEGIGRDPGDRVGSAFLVEPTTFSGAGLRNDSGSVVTLLSIEPIQVGSDLELLGVAVALRSDVVRTRNEGGVWVFVCGWPPEEWPYRDVEGTSIEPGDKAILFIGTRNEKRVIQDINGLRVLYKIGESRFVQEFPNYSAGFVDRVGERCDRG